jgi:hypothetical protein
VTSKANKLLEKMRGSKNSWKRKDLDSLFLGFGFIIRNGNKHDIVTHPDFPQLRTSLPRHTYLAKGYVEFAVALVDELLKLRSRREDKNERTN